MSSSKPEKLRFPLNQHTFNFMLTKYFLNGFIRRSQVHLRGGDFTTFKYEKRKILGSQPVTNR